MEGCFDVADVIDEDPSVGGAHRHHHTVQLKVQGRAGPFQCNVQHTLPAQTTGERHKCTITPSSSKSRAVQGRSSVTHTSCTNNRGSVKSAWQKNILHLRINGSMDHNFYPALWNRNRNRRNRNLLKSRNRNRN
jgi:hypothetical protein